MMDLSKTQALREVPKNRLPEIKQRNQLGKCFMLGSIPLFALFGFAVIAQNGLISVTAIFLLLVAVFVLVTGANIYSNQFVRGAMEIALNTVKTLGGLR